MIITPPQGSFSKTAQAQKFRGADELDSDDDLGEESLILDSPLDKIDSYQLFAATMHSKSGPGERQAVYVCIHRC